MGLQGVVRNWATKHSTQALVTCNKSLLGTKLFKVDKTLLLYKEFFMQASTVWGRSVCTYEVFCNLPWEMLRCLVVFKECSLRKSITFCSAFCCLLKYRFLNNYSFQWTKNLTFSHILPIYIDKEMANLQLIKKPLHWFSVDGLQIRLGATLTSSDSILS